MITDEALKKFVYRSRHYKHNIHKVFVVNGKKCATDGRILVAVDVLPNEVVTIGAFPNVKGVMDLPYKPCEAVELPEPINLGRCNICEGKYKDICEDCLGYGKEYKHCRITIQSVKFILGGNYLKLIKDNLPNAKITGCINNESPVKIEFDGGVCYLMPMKNVPQVNYYD